MESKIPQNKFKFRHRIISIFLDIDRSGFRYVAHRLPKWLLPKPKGALILETADGFKFFIDPSVDRSIDHSLYYTGLYEKGTRQIIAALLNKGDHVVDVGANIGSISIPAARCVGELGCVHCFEPQAKARAILEVNKLLNTFPQMLIYPFALGDKAERRRLYSKQDDRGRATLIDSNDSVAAEIVEVATLDDLLGSQLQPISLIKLDIEGFELAALSGSQVLIRKWRPALVVESSIDNDLAQPTELSALYSFLCAFGFYRLFKLRGGKGRKSKLVEIMTASAMPSDDNVFCLTDQQIAQVHGLIVLYT